MSPSDAERSNAVSFFLALQFVYGKDGQACPAHAIGMAEGNGSPVGIQFLQWNGEGSRWNIPGFRKALYRRRTEKDSMLFFSSYTESDSLPGHGRTAPLLCKQTLAVVDPMFSKES